MTEEGIPFFQKLTILEGLTYWNEHLTFQGAVKYNQEDTFHSIHAVPEYQNVFGPFLKTVGKTYLCGISNSLEWGQILKKPPVYGSKDLGSPG